MILFRNSGSESEVGYCSCNTESGDKCRSTGFTSVLVFNTLEFSRSYSETGSKLFNFYRKNTYSTNSQ